VAFDYKAMKARTQFLRVSVIYEKYPTLIFNGASAVTNFLVYSIVFSGPAFLEGRMFKLYAMSELVARFPNGRFLFNIAPIIEYLQ